jgi:hypothetical protein
MKFNHSVLIRQPVESVFEFVANVENNAQWQSDILELKMTTPGPMQVGSTYRCVNRFMGRRIETEGLVTDFVCDTKYTIRITSGDVSGESTLFFEDFEGGTRLTAVGHLDLIHLKLAAMAVRHKIKKQLKKDMRRLKKILENGAGP